MQHISDDLPRLLTGDATRDVVLEAAQHLRTCVDCQQELVSAVIAHASLTSAHRFAPEIVSPESADDEELADVSELAPVAPLPDLSSVFAEARAEAAPAQVIESSHRFRRGLVAMAAAAAVVVGGGITYAAVSGGDDAPSTRTVALEGVTDGKDGSVELVGSNRMRIDASALPKLTAGRQYEVWLTDDNGKDKQPVGYIDTADRKKELTVPSKVMSQYNNIAVSIQKARQTEYSGITVLSGSYG